VNSTRASVCQGFIPYTALGRYDYEVLSMSFFWVVTPCELVGRYQHFGETYCLYLQCCMTSALKFARRYNSDHVWHHRRANPKSYIMGSCFLLVVCSGFFFLDEFCVLWLLRQLPSQLPSLGPDAVG
jgi:hypothetical protein